MSRIKRQRREFRREHPPVYAPHLSTWKGPPGPQTPVLHILEAKARELRPRTLGRRVIQLLRWADQWARHLVEPGDFAGLVRLARLDWVRPVDTVVAQDLPGLFDGLVGRYRVPAWVYGALGYANLREAMIQRFLDVGVRLAKGGSYADVEPLLHGELNRRVYANLLASTQTDPLLALRHAQVQAFGGPAWLADALARHHRYADNLRLPVLAMLPWLCRNAEQTELDLVLAYLRDVPIDLTGRTWTTVRRLAEVRRVGAPPIDQRPLPESGFVAVLGVGWEAWRLRELRTPLEIFVEGNVMRHCVASYIPLVRSGVTSIWSFRIGEERSITVEVRNRAREIVQVRGRLNRPASPEEKRVLHAWAQSNGLAVVDASAR